MRRDNATATVIQVFPMRQDGMTRNDRIRAYLDGKLEGQALEDFELALFDDPLLLQDVETEQALRTGLRDLDADLRTRAAPPSVVTPLKQPEPSRLRPALAVAAAALLIVALVPTWLLLTRDRAPAGATLASAPANLPSLRLDRLRSGATNAYTVLLPAGAPGLSLQFVRAQRPEVRDYSLELSGPDGRIERFDALRPGPDLLIRVDVPGAGLAAGGYTARLLENRNDGSSSEVLRESFSLNR